MTTPLTQLIEEQKKELEEKLRELVDGYKPDYVISETQDFLTTAITKGYELAKIDTVNSVHDWIKANIQDDGSTGTKVNAHALVCFLQAHLKETKGYELALEEVNERLGEFPFKIGSAGQWDDGVEFEWRGIKAWVKSQHTHIAHLKITNPKE